MPDPINGYSEEESIALLAEYDFMENMLLTAGPVALWDYLKSVPDNTKNNAIMFYVTLSVTLQQHFNLP